MHCSNPASHSDGQSRTVVSEDERVSEAIVRLVATATDVDPLELEPLGNRIDCDAVDALFESQAGVSPTTRTLTVRFDEYTVTVEGTAAEQRCVVHRS
jgi:hypothetical protein